MKIITFDIQNRQGPLFELFMFTWVRKW